ncbi:sensor domain-containing protein, partial [Mycobacterium sp. ACS4331]|uniref:sensor domain-containing protein n=1 Tax=Mycobacterium sp. ACS4331 TaxID=1834121 RepID=UPI0007FF02AF
QPQPGAPLPYPPEQTNTLATLSVVFAFVFAPVGALLGHLALGQIKQTHERGRERALIGMTLSYAVIVFAVIALVAMLTVVDRSGDTPTVASDEPSLTVPAPAAPPATTAPRQSRVDISNVLLSLDEVRTIMKTPGLSPSSSSGSGSGADSDKDVTAEPEECLSAVAAGIDTVYEGKGGRDYKRASFSDNSVLTIVDQVAVGFQDAAAAHKFVAESRTQWQQCAGRTFSLTSPSGTITWDIGTPTGGPERVAVRSTITAGPGVPQFRVLAVKGSVVVDIAVVSPTATTEPDVITDRILARIPS